jgi:caffeoyl-CoA O-methyltransferase
LIRRRAASAEVALIGEVLERYALEHTTRLGDWMDALEREARSALPHPQMLSGPVVGRLLELLVHGVRARNVLEIGTYAGYSALAMAGGLHPEGRIVTCEIEPEFAGFARRYIAQSPHSERIDVRVGPALETLGTLSGPFDFVFIDADKTGYPAYLEAVLPKLAPAGLIALDNTLRGGTVLDPGGDEAARVIDELNSELARDERVVCTLLTVRDGITLVRRR